ncbi:FadR/GntR family transcriptional regulator [Paenibacillus abyssi]|uniref:Transcriptional regulator n=1 Tax=Paenibacillus abyssi TaxID=1340531 RepID=A0A917CXZ3_9BACL|nr:FadR/GntR family transcriptional regulator [Paenibacillus abyssi]GGG02289.1 transcriptional regulator [Paenibacillus abyssi]
MLNNKEYQFEPVPKNSLVVELTKRLLDYIFSGSIRPGDKLPTERKLQEAMQVGRSAIREALKALTVLGIVEVRQGDGTYLKKLDSALLTQSIEWGLLLGEKHMMDIIEARKEIEISIVKYAAERRTPEEVQQLGEILERLKHSTLDNFVEHDIAFHLKLAEMAKNTALKGVLTSLQSLLRTWIKCVIDAAGETSFSYVDHYNIYKAVSEGNPLQAVKAMEAHMGDATSRLINEIQKDEQLEAEPPV